MPVVMVVLRLLPPGGGLEIFLKPVGTTITGKPTRFPRLTFSQSVALPMKASTVKLFLTSLIIFPLALCACREQNVKLRGKVIVENNRMHNDLCSYGRIMAFKDYITMYLSLIRP